MLNDASEIAARRSADGTSLFSGPGAVDSTQVKTADRGLRPQTLCSVCVANTAILPREDFKIHMTFVP